MSIELYMGDCLDLMPTLEDGSIDLILADLPYGTTACKWDTIIPLEPLWAQYKRVIKRNGAIVLTASQPFTSALVMSNPKWFKYQWIWVKGFPTGFLNANRQPLKATEDVLVFSEGGAGSEKRGNPMPYYPQGLRLVNVEKRNKPNSRGQHIHQEGNIGHANILNSTEPYRQQYAGYPSNILHYQRDMPQQHPTQKPVALMEYLIRTYTNEGEVVLDNTMGSGTTGVACVNTGRNFIGIERDAQYFAISEKRITEAQDKARQMEMAV